MNLYKRSKAMCKSSECPSDRVKSLNKSRKVIVGVNDMATTHPELAKELVGDPTSIVAGTNKKLDWICPKGHHYQATGNKRYFRKDGCPYCSGRRVLAGFNDLATVYPRAAKLLIGDPTKVSSASAKKLRWRCDAGHEWTAICSNVSRKGYGCPVCSNQVLVVGINDMATTRPDLAKELIGDPTKYMAGSHFLLRWRCAKGHEWAARGSSRTKNNSGCPVCAGKKVWPGENDMATTHPKLAEELIGTDPSTVIAGTNKKLRWKCPVGHNYVTTGNKRVTREEGCPYCAGKRVLRGFNDILTTHPEVAKTAVNIDPATVSFGSSARALWKCPIGHIWDAPVFHRTCHNTGCPVCIGQKVLPGFNDLATTHPQLAVELVGDPTKHVAGTNKTLQWRCSKGHEYRATGSSRKAGGGCPVCASKKVLVGFNDMATTHPKLAKELVGDPTKHIAGTYKKLLWKCENGHEYKSSGESRSRLNSGCAICAGQKVLAGFNDMATTHPELAKELLGDPTKYIAGTTVVLRWRCSKGHEWRTRGRNRSKPNGSGCPRCAKTGHDQTKESFFYLVTRPGQFKIGIMNTETIRLKKHSRSGWKVIDKILMEGELVRLLETKVKQLIRKKGIPTGAKAFRESFEGYSEAWQAVDLDVTSIEDMLEKLGTSLEALLER